MYGQTNVEYLLLLGASIILVTVTGTALLNTLEAISQEVSTPSTTEVNFDVLRDYTVDINFTIPKSMLFSYIYVIVESPEYVSTESFPVSIDYNVVILSDGEEVNYSIYVNDQLIENGTIAPQTLSRSYTVNNEGEYNICAVVHIGSREVGSCSAATVYKTAVSGWKYRKALLVYSNKGGDVVFYIDLNTRALYNERKIRSDCGDLRVLDERGQEVPMWILPGTCLSNTRIFLRSTLKKGGTTFFYVYYGNPSATSISNPKNVFDVYEDFSGRTINGFTLELNESNIEELGEGSASYYIRNGRLYFDVTLYRSRDTYSYVYNGVQFTNTYPTWRYYIMKPTVPIRNPLIVYSGRVESGRGDYRTVRSYGTYIHTYKATALFANKSIGYGAKGASYSSSTCRIRNVKIDWWSMDVCNVVMGIGGSFPRDLVTSEVFNITNSSSGEELTRAVCYRYYVDTKNCRYRTASDVKEYITTSNSNLRFGVILPTQQKYTVFGSAVLDYQNYFTVRMYLDYIGMGPSTDFSYGFGPEERVA